MKNFNEIDGASAFWLSVARAKGVGPKTFWHHYQRDPLMQGLPTIDVRDEIKAHKTAGCGILTALDDVFPLQLRDLPDCPPLFSYVGNPEILRCPAVAIVGARNASPGGLKLAFSLAKHLTEAGFIIVSGLARGIDGAAHEGSLAAKLDSNADKGRTVAVLAGGIDQIYPPEHQKLYAMVRESGCIISEMPFGTAPAAALFPRRNRLIAGLCQGLIVIEAAEKSGTLITAEYAANLGRDVFVVPGSPLDPRSRGGNRLLKQGAILIEKAEDVIEQFQWTLERGEPREVKDVIIQKTKDNARAKNQPETIAIDTGLPQWLVNLGTDPISIEDLWAMMGKPQSESTATLMATLALLEMDGHIIRLPGGLIQRVLN